MQERLFFAFFLPVHCLLYALVFFACFFSSLPSALAGDPFLTDDPGTVGENHFEFFISSVGARDKGNGTRGLAQIELNYGAADNLDLHLLIMSGAASDAGTMLNFNSAGGEVGAKYRFIEESASMPAIAVYPRIFAPLADNDDGGDTTLFLPLWLQKQMGEWNTFAGGGHALMDGAGNKNWTFLGWGLRRAFSDLFDLGAELFYLSATERDGNDSFGSNVGGSIKLNDHYNFLASAGHDFSGDSAVRYFVGIQGVY